MIENDLIIWLDDKTGDEINDEQKNMIIDKIRNIVNDYGLDFYMCGSPKSIKKALDFIDFEEESKV